MTCLRSFLDQFGTLRVKGRAFSSQSNFNRRPWRSIPAGGYRLASVSDGAGISSYLDNGLGDRLQQTVNGETISYTLDLNPSASLGAGSGLTQVLQDGTSSYLYGNGRIAQLDTGTLDTQYFLGDALGSVRQMAGQSGTIVYAASYSPYGEVIAKQGTSQTSYGYTGEMTDSSGMVYLRSRYYRAANGRFLNRDTWSGEANDPGSFNRWAYVQGNPINLTDPNGMHPGFHSQYCVPLTGVDRLYCDRIVRGLDPAGDVTFHEMRMYDYCSLVESCACERILDRITNPNPLQDDLPHRNLSYEEYGWWFHFLMDQASSSGNSNGKNHVNISDVISYAIAVELSTFKDPYYKSLYIEAVANKISDPNPLLGVYSVIGSRDSVISRVNTAILKQISEKLYQYQICGPTTPRWFDDDTQCKFLHDQLVEFANSFNDYQPIDLEMGTSVVKLLRTTFADGSRYHDAPWDVGNPTDHTINDHPGILAAFHMPRGTQNDQLIYHTTVSDYPQPAEWYLAAFAVTADQQSILCAGTSCVKP